MRRLSGAARHEPDDDRDVDDVEPYVAVAGVVVVLGGIAAAVLGLGAGDGDKASADTALPPKTTKVTAGDPARHQHDGRRARFRRRRRRRAAGSTGTVTKLPAVGDTVNRGKSLYEIDDVPVTLDVRVAAGIPRPQHRRRGCRRRAARGEPRGAWLHRLRRRRGVHLQHGCGGQAVAGGPRPRRRPAWSRSEAWCSRRPRSASTA